MATILNIETSTRVCSVALSSDGQVIHNSEDHDNVGHSVCLGVFVQEALSFAESHAMPLDAVAVSQGPGSYTGLRIGVSMAKGVCYGRRIPLIAVSTLQLMCVEPLLYHEEIDDDALLLPMLDARRMEVYSAVYDRSLAIVRDIQADVVTQQTYSEFLTRPVYYFGDGAAKCQQQLDHPQAHLIDNILPLARNMVPLAERAFARQEFADVAYFEPFYLKEYVALLPKKMI